MDSPLELTRLAPIGLLIVSLALGVVYAARPSSIHARGAGGRLMTTLAEYPRVHYLAALPEYWIIRSAPDTFWLVGDRQPWPARRRYGGPLTAIQTPSPQTARLVLEQLGLPTGAYTLPNESQSHYATIAS